MWGYYFEEAWSDSFDLAGTVVDLVENLVVTYEDGSSDIYCDLVYGYASCSLSKEVKIGIILTFFIEVFGWEQLL